MVQKVSVFDTLLQHAEFVIHKADVERRVMDHQLAAADKVEEFVGNLIEGRLVGREIVADAVYAVSFRSTSRSGLM